MEPVATAKAYRTAGMTWSRLGWAILMLTVIAVVCVWLLDSWPPEGMFFLLTLGGIPATLCFLIVIFSCRKARHTTDFSDSRWKEWKGIRQATAGLLTLVIFAGVLAAACASDAGVAKQWVRDAEAVVAKFLSDPSKLKPFPTSADGIPPQLGKFLDLEGKGHSGAAWNIQGYEYLTAQRMARFENGNLPVKIYVEEGTIVAPSSKTVFVRLDQWSSSIPGGSFGQGISLHVAHPDLH